MLSYQDPKIFHRFGGVLDARLLSMPASLDQ
jgi:hypothetical protein